MNIQDKVGVITGAASGIGRALTEELANRGAKAVGMVDQSDQVDSVARELNEKVGREVAIPFQGDVSDEHFRQEVFRELRANRGIVSMCVPAAGITRDRLAVKSNKETKEIEIYPSYLFRQVTEINLIAPIYWALEMVAQIANDRKERGLKRWDPSEGMQGVVVFIGSVSSLGNKGQIAYAATKAGLEGAASTIMKESIFHGVRSGVIHPGYTNTPMVRALGEDFINEHIIPQTQLRRLIEPAEIADAICFMIKNVAVSGSLWADAGWHPMA